MIAVCTPSRGLIFSRCVQGIIEGMQALNQVGVATKYCYTHDLPIPACHNACVEKALSDPAVDKVFFIEEDMYIDPQTFVALATSPHDIATVNYNDRNGSVNGIIHYNEAHEILWSGLGATVIKREVFEAVGQPYFRTDTRYKIVKKHQADGSQAVTDFEELETKSEYQYGGLDVDFFARARKAGFKITCLPNYHAYQFVLMRLGEPYVNNGCHEINQV